MRTGEGSRPDWEAPTCHVEQFGVTAESLGKSSKNVYEKKLQDQFRDIEIDIHGSMENRRGGEGGETKDMARDF